MGFVKIEETARPDRAIHLNGERVYWPPPGCITSAEAARRMGISEAQLRSMRTGKDSQNRGPVWLTAANAHHIAYTPEAVATYCRARARALQAQANAMLARVEQAEPAEQAVDAERPSWS
jgi:hypothetical protein